MRLVMNLRHIGLALLAVAGVSLSGCGGGGGGGGNGLPDPTMRFYNGISDMAAINFLLDDDVIAALLPYLGSTPDFKDVKPEIKDLRLQEDGTSVDLWSEVINPSKDKHYLVTAIGLKNFGTETLKRPRFFTVEIDRTPPNGTRAKLQIIHAYNRAANFGTPNIDFQTPGNNPQFKANDVGYGNGRLLEVDAGNFTWEARVVGTENVIASKNVTLTGGRIYAAFVLGVEGGAGAAAPRIEFVELATK